MKIAGSGSGSRSISQRHGSMDLDPNPDLDPLIRGMDQWIRTWIHIKMARIRNTAIKVTYSSDLLFTKLFSLLLGKIHVDENYV
jgi:hypothetical protein